MTANLRTLIVSMLVATMQEILVMGLAAAVMKMKIKDKPMEDLIIIAVILNIPYQAVQGKYLPVLGTSAQNILRVK